VHFIVTALDAILTVTGALIVASLGSILLWRVFRQFRHPEWSVFAISIVVALALVGRLPHDDFVRFALVFAIVAGLPLWIKSKAWYAFKNRKIPTRAIEVKWPPINNNGTRLTPNPVGPRESQWRYPLLTACIRDNRQPSRQEIHKLASRIWSESFSGGSKEQATSARFSTRRKLLRAATHALTGEDR
jgi:hypothetical protein